MDRLFCLAPLVLAWTGLAGCRAPTPNFDPFAITGQTRVPPPPTGAVGRPGSYLPPAPTPLPQSNPGPGTWPQENFSPPPQSGSSGLYPANPSATSSLSEPDTFGSEPVAFNDSLVRRGDRLTWSTPNSSTDREPLPIREDPSVVSYPSTPPAQHLTSGPAWPHQPRLLPQTGPTQPLDQATASSPPPLSSPPRIRGFVNAGVRELRIPAELADFSGREVNQVSTASGGWQSRYAAGPR